MDDSVFNSTGIDFFSLGKAAALPYHTDGRAALLRRPNFFQSMSYFSNGIVG
jgi:hypothetical protein